MRFSSLLSTLSLLACAAVASATPITGSVSISGNDSFNSKGITFHPSTGTVYQASGTMSEFAPFQIGSLSVDLLATLTSFQFDHAAGTKVFSVTNLADDTLSFTITSLLTDVIGHDSNGPTLSISGLGTFMETGYTSTSGMFSLTSSSAGITGFQLVSSAPTAVTPEPTSIALLGTGLMGIAGVMKRRFA